MWKTRAAYLEEERDFLRAQVAQLQSYILMVGPANFPVPPALAREGDNILADEPDIESTHRMYTTEEEEDIEYALEEGLIGREEAERILRDLDVPNPNIEF